VNDPDSVREGLLRSFADADVVVSHPTMCTVTIPVATHVGVPVVVGHLFPMLVPTRRTTPPLGARSFNFGHTVNHTFWRATATMTRLVFHDNEVNRFRQTFGLARQPGSALIAWADAVRTVMLVSPHYFGDPPPDWPPITWGGFSVWPGPAGQTADPAVDAFINAGDSPVLVTLGTSAATGAGERFAAIGRGLDRLGLRSLHLVADERNMEPLKGRDGAFVFAPMTQVLPRCRTAVVSGALGALSTALKFGVPVVVVPQLFDQLWHGGRVEELGVGIMAHSARGVTRAVARIEADPRYRERAQALAARMANEDGAAVLADVTESIL
jgi:rhamnosyltransferase subunit B